MCKFLLFLAALCAGSAAGLRAGVAGFSRRRVVGVAAKKKGFATTPRKPKAPSTITVDDDDDRDVTLVAAEGSSSKAKNREDEIFAKYGVKDTVGTRPRRELVAEQEGPWEPLKNVPPAVQIGIERTLIGGALGALVVFVFIGFGIAYEAYAIATKNPLPPDTDKFIVETVEPLFTPSLVFGLGCSITLGGFKTLQLTSDSGQYSEDDE